MAVLGPALAAFALTRNPRTRTDNARIKTRMAYSPLILKSFDDLALKTYVGSHPPP